MFNKLRKKRHTAVYEQTDIISKAEAESALVISKEFVGKVHKLLYPQKKR